MVDKGANPRDRAFAVVMGRNITRYREALGISQEDLGFLADLHRTAVGQLERGERTARADTVLKLCGSLGIEPSALFEGLSWTPAEYSKGELIIQLGENGLKSRGPVVGQFYTEITGNNRSRPE